MQNELSKWSSLDSSVMTSSRIGQVRLPAEYSKQLCLCLMSACHKVRIHSGCIFFTAALNTLYSFWLYFYFLALIPNSNQFAKNKMTTFFAGFPPNCAPNGSKSFKTQNMYNPLALSSGANTCDTVLDLA